MTNFVRAFAGLALLSACGVQDVVRDVCEDGGQCASDASCPQNPPNTGQACPAGMADNAVCFYCTEGDRVDATQFECEGERFQRRENIDCD